MIQIEDVVKDVNVYGLDKSIKRSKYPMATNTSKCNTEITERVKSLANAPKGSGHDNFLKGIIVQFDLTFTIKAWTEAERYNWFDIVSSQSTMHRLPKFDVAMQYIEYTDSVIVNRMLELIADYNEEPTKEKELKLLYSNPTGFRLTAGMSTNYDQLKTIYSQRKSHKLPEWVVFCKWIETLPHSELIIGENA